MNELYWIPLGVAAFIVLYLIMGSFSPCAQPKSP
jgi:hypothetical protein